MSVDLRTAREDLGVFSRLIDRPLVAWQVRALRLERRTTVVVAPRQTGKSRSLAVLALHRAFRRADQHVLIISAGEDAARRLLGEVRVVAALSPVLSGSVVDEQASLVTLSNGSTIRSVPASERQVRGWTVDLLLVDEAALVEDDLLLGAALPTTAARPDARVVLASSPISTQGAFYDAAMRGEQGAEHTETFRWSLGDAPWVTPEVIAALREGLPEARIRAELGGEFVDLGAEDALLEPEWILAAQRHRIPARPPAGVGFGADIARSGGDETVVMEARGLEVAGWRVRLARLAGGDVAAWHGAPTDITRARLTGVLAAGGEAAVMVVDSVGLGQGVHDELVARGLAVRGFSGAERAARSDRFFNRRAEAWWAVRDAFEAGLVDIDPHDAVLARQLRSLTWRVIGQRTVIGSKDELRRRGLPSPDRADALMYALEAAREAEPVVQTKDDELREWAARIERQRYWEQLGVGTEDAALFARQGSLTADLIGEAM